MNKPASTKKKLKTTCCIVGAGPAGVILAHLLARYGVDVILIEAEEDFDRNFRGDTVHPSTMEILEQLDLLKSVLKYPHTQVEHLALNGNILINLSTIPSKFQYMTLLHQKDFLKAITDESKKMKNFKILMETNAQKLIFRKGKVTGIECLQDGKWMSIHADLVIGADGRFSKMRQEGEFKSRQKTAPMDVLWFRVPKEKSDKKISTGARLGRGHMLVMLEREEHWQMGFIIAKGTYSELRKEGFAEFEKDLIKLAPFVKGRTKVLKNWEGVSLLNVESTMVKQWYRDGLLLIGDAAHVISPVGGVGINLAIKDAVTAANILAEPLAHKNVKTTDLAKVQRSRKLPTSIIQRFQGFAQNKILSPTLNLEKPPLAVRLLLKTPLVQKIITRAIGIGIKRVKVDEKFL